MEQRLKEYDFIRVLCVFGVIAIHVTSHFVTKTELAFAWNQLSRFAVPMFMILSGFFLFYKDRHYPPNKWVPMKNRIVKLMIPYLLWTTVYALFTQGGLMENGNYSMWFSYWLEVTLLGKGYVHLYFMLIVFQFYLLYPLFRRWFYRSPKSLLFLTFIITLVMQTLVFISNNPNISYTLPDIWYSYSVPIPVWCFYFISGMWLAHHRDRWESWIKGKGWLFFLLWIASYVLLFMDSKSSSTFMLSMKPTIIIYCFASFFFFFSMGSFLYRKKKWWHSTFDWISTQSFLIFLLHPLLLTVLSQEAGENKWSFLWSGNTGFVAQYLIVVISTFLFSYLFSRFSVQWLGGVPARRK
ncbi:acyltransferase [Brevibacillus daliensis]|uniref:acyltransferase n=1 Tax=Brevibacillus daliensis TaxID=2892995 RepID=UPI001E2CD7D6|nr:acyltransferase [Brevibacillus daliensis]